MSYKLFLDDIRNPGHCLSYMYSRMGEIPFDVYNQEWVVVRNFNEFVKAIQERGNPDIISFDHDLEFAHYVTGDKGESIYDDRTGYHCAGFYRSTCWENDWEYAKILIHSMNPIGVDRISSIFK